MEDGEGAHSHCIGPFKGEGKSVDAAGQFPGETLASGVAARQRETLGMAKGSLPLQNKGSAMLSGKLQREAKMSWVGMRRDSTIGKSETVVHDRGRGGWGSG